MFKKCIFLVLVIILFPSISFGGQTIGKFSISLAPSYYSLEDLRYFLKQESFYFANENKPVYAKVDLGYAPFYAASTQKRDDLSVIVSSSPSDYRIKTSRILADWNDGSEIMYDDSAWSSFSMQGGRKGDLIFTRGNSTANNIVKIFSNWTHVAMVYDSGSQRVFEASPDTDVDINSTRDVWGPLTYYTCKRIGALNDYQVSNAVDSAVMVYMGKPYFPAVKTTFGVTYFLYKWSNKYDMDSMYCSKLVFHTFRPYISLDTNNTGVMNDKLQEKVLGAPLFCWIGVSPDDIYYSDALEADFAYSQNLDYL